MNYLILLVPLALGMGLVGLVAFLWSMKTGQLEDLDGAAERILLAEASEYPLTDPGDERQGQHGAVLKPTSLRLR